jgi:uncharacterized membrane protein
MVCPEQSGPSPRFRFMTTSSPQAGASRQSGTKPNDASQRIDQNIESIADFYSREQERVSSWQRLFEHISTFMGRPLHIGALLLAVVAWIVVNTWGSRYGIPQLDPPPFSWLSLALTAYALLTALVVLVKQNRFGKLEEHRAHLDLQVNLLTEQKVSKLIHLVEELRHDLPFVENRVDAEVNALEREADPHAVLSAISERLTAAEQFPRDLRDTPHR